ncbi:hypothetical protein ACFS6H_04390 [Terrimonas rubra]|uniref:Uncharacterized protein n=1 Tax=Terrimonas rubra TaxID=1035890 RepID=A0ABW6A5G5_9BACT
MNTTLSIEIDQIQQVFQQFNLSEEQALRIYYHEKEKSIFQNNLHFSYWEEADHDLHFFRSVLKEEQFRQYEQQLKDKILHHEHGLAVQDNDKQKEIAYYKEVLDYYKTTLLPALTDLRFFPFFGLIFSERSKYNYLQSEYKKFVQYTRKDMLVHHFRNYRQLMPNQLKVSLLSHSLHFYLPDYSSFRDQMDIPTKSMAQYFEEKVCRVDKTSKQAIVDIIAELDVFTNSIYPNYFEESCGWHVDIGISEEDAILNSLMSVLLIDKDHYEVDKYDIYSLH